MAKKSKVEIRIEERIAELQAHLQRMLNNKSTLLSEIDAVNIVITELETLIKKDDGSDVQTQ